MTKLERHKAMRAARSVLQVPLSMWLGIGALVVGIVAMVATSMFVAAVYGMGAAYVAILVSVFVLQYVVDGRGKGSK